MSQDSVSSGVNFRRKNGIRQKVQEFASVESGERSRMLRQNMFHYGIRLPIQLSFGLAGLLIIALLKVLKPLVTVRVGRLYSERVGHFAASTELYLRKRWKHSSRKREYAIFLSCAPANRQLLTMIRRRIPVTHSRLLFRIHSALYPYVPNSSIWIHLPKDGHGCWEEFNRIPPQLTFTDEENRRGQDLLASMGISRGEPFVCFHARDGAYLDATQKWRSRDEWSYHDHRDSSITNYLPAAEALAQRGIWVLRMGAVVSSPISSLEPRVIDYATRYRSDFGDVYLCGFCKFFLSGSAGIERVSTIFNVPLAITNHVPIGYAPGWRHTDLFIPKKYWHVERKRFLTFREVIAMGADRWVYSQRFATAGIEVVENTAHEILDLAMEMNSRLDGIWRSQDEDQELQDRYRALFPPDHQITGYPSRVGAEFLRQNRELLD